MGRTTPPKGIHTSPSKAGVKNMPNAEDLPKDETNNVQIINEVFKLGKQKDKAYKGLWTEELFNAEIGNFFDYCAEFSIKPVPTLLQLWLGVSKAQFGDWIANESRYGYKSSSVKKAMQIIETYLQMNIDKYPTGNIFLLKTTHGHVDQARIDVTSGGARIGASADEVADMISKLGLDLVDGE